MKGGGPNRKPEIRRAIEPKLCSEEGCYVFISHLRVITQV